MRPLLQVERKAPHHIRAQKLTRQTHATRNPQVTINRYAPATDEAQNSRNSSSFSYKNIMPRYKRSRRPATTTPAQSRAPRGHAHHGSRKGHRREDYSEWRLTVKMVGPDRLELSASVLSGLRSNHLSYGPKEERGPWLTLPSSICRPPPSVNESGPLPDTLTLTPTPLSASLKVVSRQGTDPSGSPLLFFFSP